MSDLQFKKRSPVVVVLGHVDHGKTSLLDKIRSTNVASKEAGGITQKVSTSEVVTKEGRKIVFIDTPGHAAFSLMRKRGSTIADLAVLVVAADDGVKPQTAEAINHIQQSQIPFVVAINKTDLASANIEMALGQLAEHGVLLEKRGGNVPYVLVSAKTGTGLPELLETLGLMWDLAESKKDEGLVAFVLESEKGKAGCQASVVVKSGQINVGDTIYVGTIECKVRGILRGKEAKKTVTAGEVAVVLGFDQLPPIGDIITVDKKDSFQEEALAQPRPATFTGKSSDQKQLSIVVKTDNAGSLEALLASIPEGFEVLDSGVGDVNESEVMSAKAKDVLGIFLFNVTAPQSVQKLAESEGVTIYSFKIIYELLEKLAEIHKSGLIVQLGKATIVAEFPFNNMRVAGCKMTFGKISRSSHLTLMRGDTELGKIKVMSLKKQKVEVGEVANGEEFGILFTPHLDFKLGDAIIASNR